MNESILEEIENLSKAEENKSDEVVEKTTWLVFSIFEKKFAIKSTEVHEIIKDMKIYKLPFLPSYIEGLINRRGDPFAVINIHSLIENAEKTEDMKVPEKLLFLVLNRDDDQISFHISDILFFFETESAALQALPDDSGNNVYLGIIEYSGEKIPVLNPEAFVNRIQKDLGK